MDTSQALQNIPDATFELLGAFYLRHRDPQLAGLISTGTNEAGKPIPCPVDGILYVPGNPPRNVKAAYTTTKRERLRGKWLGTNRDQGDLAKAIGELDAWRVPAPDAVREVYLVTNRSLQSDTALYRDVIEAGQSQQVAVHVVEASQLVEFLDYDPDGQYWRGEVLGIRAKRISHKLRVRQASQIAQDEEWSRSSGAFAFDQSKPISVLSEPGNGVGGLATLEGLGQVVQGAINHLHR
jgi:hypothetical protein